MIKLYEATIHQYRCIDKEQVFDVKDDITIFIGRNEAGKTTLLEALAKANYFDRNDESYSYSPFIDFPRRKKRELEKQAEAPLAVTLKYIVSADLVKKIKTEMLLEEQSNCFSRITNYEGKHQITENGFEYSTNEFWKTYTKQKAPLLENFRKSLSAIYDLNGFDIFVDRIKTEIDETTFKSLQTIRPYFENRHGWENPLNEYVFRKYLLPQIPKFMYYSDLAMLPSRISIDKLLENKPLTESEKTAKLLLLLADIDLNKLIQSPDDYKADLETIQAEMTESFLKYWSNDKNIRLEFEIIREPREQAKRSKISLFRRRTEKTRLIDSYLEIRVGNQKSMVSFPLEKRSKGFNAFFSFWVWFKALQKEFKTPYILLLDEPGLSLHAETQKNLMQLIMELSLHNQVLFTTHSPYMLKDLQDRIFCIVNRDDETTIRSANEETDEETLIPLFLYDNL